MLKILKAIKSDDGKNAQKRMRSYSIKMRSCFFKADESEMVNCVSDSAFDFAGRSSSKIFEFRPAKKPATRATGPLLIHFFLLIYKPYGFDKLFDGKFFFSDRQHIV